MRIPIYQVDAFTEHRFRGNPAAVCPLEAWLEDDTLKNIAAENNLSETAFLVPIGSPGAREAAFEIRWFTPTCEVELCGHGTLAAAYVAYVYLGVHAPRLHFATRKAGALTVMRSGDDLAMDFPLRQSEECFAPAELTAGLGATPAATLRNEAHYLVVFDSERDVQEIEPDFGALAVLHPLAVCVTAPGNTSDFVSRYFAPSFGINEDPVTGSSHCALAAYWSERLGKRVVHGLQISERRGSVRCSVRGDRVELTGRCAPYLVGEIEIG